MIEELFTEKLAYFKQNEKPEVVLLVAENPEFVKMIVTWPILDIARQEKAVEPTGDSEKEVWEWLWKNVRFSLTELKELADIHLADCVLEKKMKLLIGNRILYPDGTVNSYVERYLKERVVKLFETRPNKPVKKA